MTRLLVCGLCPLPGENARKNYGPGIRTWQFAWSLARAGHAVTLLAMRIGDAYGELPASPAREHVDGVDVVRCSAHELLETGLVAQTIATLRPEAVVGATLYGSNALARAAPTVPFWADQFGHVMAEAQAKAALDGSDAVLPYFWRLLQPVLQRADRISVVSERQRWAALGELGAAGRLNAASCGYEFTAVLPCAQIPVALGRELRKASGADDPFVVLWSGSYNTWSDVRTLYLGVEAAMRVDSRIRFVSIGGEIPGQDERTYRSFCDLVQGSAFRDRFRLDGWVETRQVADYLRRADLAVLTEQPIYEGMLGSKNRVIQWLGSGLPVAYNRMGDLGDLLARERLGLLFDVGDAPGLAERILWAAAHPVDLAAMARRAEAYTLEHLSFESTAAPLVAWAGRPTQAPDAGMRQRAGGGAAAGELGGLLRSPSGAPRGSNGRLPSRLLGARWAQAVARSVDAAVRQLAHRMSRD